MKTKRLSLLIAAIALTGLLLTAGTGVFAGDKEDPHKRVTSSEHRSGPKGLIDRISEKRRKIHQALLDHHRKERAFIIGLVTGGERRYHSEEKRVMEKYYDPAPAPAHNYSRPAPAPAPVYNKPAPAPAPEYKPAPAPDPAPRKKDHKYPGYSGY